MPSINPYVARYSHDRLRMSISAEDMLKITDGPLSLVHVTNLNTGRRYLIGFLAGTILVIEAEYK
jgi:hypothetical protein